MELFAICCTTCNARLKVRDAAAIGKILACPKCGSMVQVAAPAGWVPPTPETANKISAETSTGSTIVTKAFVPEKGAKVASAGPNAAAKPATTSGAAASGASAPLVPAKASEMVPAGATASAAAATSPTPINPDDVPPIPFAEPGPSLASRLLDAVSQHRLVLLTSPVVLIVLALFAWIMFHSGGEPSESVALAPDVAITTREQDDSAVTPIPQVNDDVANATPPVGQQPSDTVAPDSSADASAVDGAADVAANRPDNRVRDLADLAADPPVEDAAAGDDAAPADAPDVAGNARNIDPAAPGHLAKPIVPVDAAPDGDGLPKTANDGEAAGVADGEMVVGQESMPPVDVVARLADPLPSVQFKRVALADFCDFLSRMSTIPITLDVDALAMVSVRPGDQFSISLEDTTVGDALTELLAKRGLMFLVEGQQVIVTSPDRKTAKLLSASYDVSDLAPGGGEEVARLAALVPTFVCPTSWQEKGGKGRIRVVEGALAVDQDPIVQHAVAVFLDKLRQARGLATKENLKPEEVALKSSYALAKANLDKVVTANFSLETPLVEVLSWLSRATATRIIIDEASLAQAGLWSHQPAKVVVEKQPLYDALSSLLTPIGMTYRIVDERTVQVFARQSLPDRYDFEIYPMADLLAARLDPKEIVSRLRGQFEAVTWTDGGGLGAMDFDEASKCLLVVQAPDSQVRLENMLLRAKPNSRPAP